MKAPIHSTKHIVQNSLFAVASGAITNANIVVAVDVAAKNTVTEVEEGCVIKAVYVEMWLTGDDVVASTCIATLEKISSNGPSMTVAQSAALMDYPNKKNIFQTFMGLMPPNTQYPMAIFKGWVKIPKGKQRFGLGDRLVLNMHGQSDGLTGCGFFIYKEYT